MSLLELSEIEQRLYKHHIDILIDSLNKFEQNKKSDVHWHATYALIISAEVEAFLRLIVQNDQQKARLNALAAAREIEKVLHKGQRLSGDASTPP